MIPTDAQISFRYLYLSIKWITMWLSKELNESEAWDVVKPICRELYDLANGGKIQFVSGAYNEENGTYKINLKCNRIHLASRGFRDSIGDIEYEPGKIRVGLRANGAPVNLFADLM
jgi:hypothetical protein